MSSTTSSSGKGSARRPERRPGAYAEGWERVFGKTRGRGDAETRGPKTTPLPGTAEALAAGCTCPVIDNRERPDHLKVYTEGCPVHHPAAAAPLCANHHTCKQVYAITHRSRGRQSARNGVHRRRGQLIAPYYRIRRD